MTEAAVKQSPLLDKVDDPKKRRILEAALHEFAEKGYQGTSIRDIAKRAGTASGLMYYYFKDKEALFIKLCRYLREEMAENFFGGISYEDTFAALYDVCKAKLRFYSEHPDAYIVLTEEMRVFPKVFAQEGMELRKNTGFWSKIEGRSIPDDKALLFEIMRYAFDGLENELFNQYLLGEISAGEISVIGIDKAKTYIDYFRKLYHQAPTP